MTISVNVQKRCSQPTNGDVIKALFPNQPIYEQRNVAIFYGDNMRFDPTWWDTPYKENKNES